MKNINLKFLFVVFAILVISGCNGPQKTDIPCKIVFENGKQLSDTCLQTSSNYYCETGISMYDDIVVAGDRVEREGYCMESRQGAGWIGP